LVAVLLQRRDLSYEPPVPGLVLPGFLLGDIPARGNFIALGVIGF
jgi:hypothetical protein